MTAASYRRVLGANDRISIGMMGCGSRGADLRSTAHGSAREMNIEITAVCDLWSGNRDKAAADVKTQVRARAAHFQHPSRCWPPEDLDAVMIATCDHQHAAH
jgi:predicted dehydrogenase